MPQNQTVSHPFYIYDTFKLITDMLTWQDKNNLRLTCRTTEKFLRADWVNKIRSEQVVNIAAYGNISFFITASGQVWVCGKEDYHIGGVTGLPPQSNNTIHGQPKQVIFPETTHIIQVAASENYSLFLTNDGQVWFIYSQNAFKNRNLLQANNNQPFSFAKVSLPEGLIITQIATGQSNHALLLTNSGQVWAFGENTCGQLGMGHWNSLGYNEAQRVELPEGTVITQLAAGKEYSLFLAQTGQAFACGKNDQGQLGLGHKQSAFKPEQVLLPKGISLCQIAAGKDHSLFLTTSGKVFVCGANDTEKTGYNKETTVANYTSRHITPLEMWYVYNIVYVATGDGHSFLSDKSGKIVVYGSDKNTGRLGLGDITRYSTKGYLKCNMPIIRIATGSSHTLFLTQTGQVFTCGQNDQGQLGLINQKGIFSTACAIQSISWRWRSGLYNKLSDKHVLWFQIWNSTYGDNFTKARQLFAAYSAKFWQISLTYQAREFFQNVKGPIPYVEEIRASLASLDKLLLPGKTSLEKLETLISELKSKVDLQKLNFQDDLNIILYVIQIETGYIINFSPEGKMAVNQQDVRTKNVNATQSFFPKPSTSKAINAPRPAIDEPLKQFVAWLETQSIETQNEELNKLSESLGCTISLNKNIRRYQ